MRRRKTWQLSLAGYRRTIGFPLNRPPLCLGWIEKKGQSSGRGPECLQATEWQANTLQPFWSAAACPRSDSGGRPFSRSRFQPRSHLSLRNPDSRHTTDEFKEQCQNKHCLASQQCSQVCLVHNRGSLSDSLSCIGHRSSWRNARQARPNLSEF